MMGEAASMVGPVVDGPSGPLVVRSRGHALLAQPLLNKGTAFTNRERDAFGLRGLLPPGVATLDEQVALELEHVRRKADDLERYIGLAALHDQNETLFYRLLVDNLEEFLPIVYTPTVGLACQRFSHIFRRPRGVWITPDDVGRIDDILRAAGDDIRLIVVTDNERILGLGDQGAGGMAIPVGKLALYTAAAGIYPARTLPVSLDVGTDNRALLDDPLYLGHRAPRLRGPAYDAVVEAFVDAVTRVFPRRRAMGGFQAAQRRSDPGAVSAPAAELQRRHAGHRSGRPGRPPRRSTGPRRAHLATRSCSWEQAPRRSASHPSFGVSSSRRGWILARRPRPSSCSTATVWSTRLGRRCPTISGRLRLIRLACSRPGSGPSDLADPVAVARATGTTVLIGASACAGAFTEALVREVGRHDPVPIVLPLSNPSACAEATPEDILAWTGGRALVATGGPSRDVAGPAGVRVIGQANNVFVFPGVGLGAIVAETREVTDDMFLVVAHELASLVSDDRLRVGALYPPVAGLRAVARTIAVAVVREARDSGHGRADSDDEIEAAIDRAMWWPDYVTFEPGG